MKSTRPTVLHKLFQVDYVTEKNSNTTNSSRETIDRSDKQFQYIMNGQGDSYAKRLRKGGRGNHGVGAISGGAGGISPD